MPAKDFVCPYDSDININNVVDSHAFLPGAVAQGHMKSNLSQSGSECERLSNNLCLLKFASFNVHG